ncbi:MAG: glutamyl-tRNA reductase [Candidatus Sumerlaeia bacterium]
MDLIVTGLSHKTAPLETRERFAFSPDETTRFLKALRREEGVREALLLSTCNRTELYACVKREDLDRARFLQDYLLAAKSVEDLNPESVFYSHNESYAVDHLFAVTSGLESMALGENQIFGQVKDAYHYSCEARANGVIINKLFHWAFRVGKRARTETKISAGAVSISSAAVELAQKIFKDLSRHTALLIGAGETGELTAESLKEKGVKRIIVTNRTYSRAEELAAKIGGEAIEWDRRAAAMEQADLVVSSTAARESILTPEEVKEIMGRRNHCSLMIIDIAVPRDFDPAIGKIYNVFLQSIDDLQAIIDKNLQKREGEAAKVRAIVHEEREKFLKWHRTLRLKPVITGLRNQFDEMREAEIDRQAKKLDPESREAIDKITRAFMNKILNQPMRKLREFNEDSQIGMARLDTVREVFGLEELPEIEDD